MWINTYVGIITSFATIIAATPHHYLDYPYFPYTPYQSNIYTGASIYSPFGYTSPYNFHTGHTTIPAFSSAHFKHQPHFRGFTYHNDFKGGSTSNVLFLTGSVANPIPSYFYPSFPESPSVEIARKKASNGVDKNFIEKKIDTKTKDLCDTFKDAFGKPGVHQFYSFDNDPLFLNGGFGFNQIPTVATWPFGGDFFGTPLVKDEKPKNVADDSLKTDAVDPERKISVRPPDQGAQGSVSVSSSSGTKGGSDAANDVTAQEEDETRTIPNLPSSDAASTEATTTTTQSDASSDDTETVDSAKKKRQSARIAKLRKL